MKLLMYTSRKIRNVASSVIPSLFFRFLSLVILIPRPLPFPLLPFLYFFFFSLWLSYNGTKYRAYTMERVRIWLSRRAKRRRCSDAHGNLFSDRPEKAGRSYDSIWARAPRVIGHAYSAAARVSLSPRRARAIYNDGR